ncbi:hypothetical protein [Streptomyces glomeratus]|uniref:Secreted protein n=1 Tax=Streptomyces glomeratus TaxID=284452 RepID=A0ABP6LDK3_9ACTN|nr:hypothetical protein [Streptomyces glomeratus]MCF1509923.1 hypothetical protein [Streptomyces glomeratus]
MRLSRRFAPVFLALALVTVLPYEAMPHARGERTERHARAERTEPHARGKGGKSAGGTGPFGADCRVRVTGTDVVAHCHNPYPRTDHVSLHIECDPWWDLDTDTAPVDVGPAMTVRLTGRCWARVRSAWVGHAGEPGQRPAARDRPGRHMNG